ncbi:hypothetical protein CLOSTMETH_01758 [[Clostridium] methylpentosum DSM 5476]|uniref:Uncharacterized protein n=1 Tax=[Clostridium] methylpentosum DSM 5476 TaxID=537013 RepID=C0ED37_9FIRM|nr:hypothetical protein CLOSTMETH_01758 [[Clostridium] methylpentosum DSM 5476]
MIRANREMIKRLRDRARVRTHWVRIAPEAEYAAAPSLPVALAGDGQYTLTADQLYASGTYAVDLSGIQWLVEIDTDLQPGSVLRIDVIQRTVYLDDSPMEPLIELDLREDTSTIEIEKTVNARMRCFSVNGASCQNVIEASQNLLDEERLKDAANWTEAAGGMADIVLVLAPDTQYTLSRADTTGLGKGVLFTIKSSTVTDLASTSIIQSTVSSLNKQARTITTGTDGCLTLSISRGADLQATLDDLWTWIGYLMLNTGDTALAHEYYHAASPSPENPSPILSLEDFDVVVRGRNILDWHGAIDYNCWHTTALDDDHPYGYYPYLVVNGFVPGETYTIAVDSIPELGAADLYCLLGTYPGANKGQVNWVYHKTSDALCRPVRTFVADAYTYYLNCNGCKADTVSQVVHDWLPNLRIYQGSYTADTIPPYTPYYRQVVHVPVALRAIGDSRDQLEVNQKVKKVTVTRRVDPEKIDPTKSIYDNPEQYLLDQPIVEDITDTATGQALLQLATYYPETIIEIQCANGLTGLMTAQMKKLGRGRIYNCIILNEGDFLVDSEGEVLEWR